jgi:exosortase
MTKSVRSNMKTKIGTMVKFASCVALLLIAYMPAIRWMVDRWSAKESYYSHGFLIPLVSLFIVWQRREILKKIEITSAPIGIWIIAVGLLINMICASLRVYFVSGFSLVVVFYGLVLFFFGKKMAKSLTFPIFFLLAMIPLPLSVIGTLTVKLKLFVAQVSTVILNIIGFPSVRDGSFIRMPKSFVAVEAPCSGLRSLVSLITMGLLFAYAMKVSYIKKVILLLSSIPIAIMANVIRVVLVAAVNDLYGEKFAMGLFHDVTGYLLFIFAFVGLYAVSQVLDPRTDKGEVKNA